MEMCTGKFNTHYVAVNTKLKDCSLLGISFNVHCSRLILFRDPHQYPNIHYGLLITKNAFEKA